LTDTIEFSSAVRAALAKVNLRETLVIVTADHSHVFTMAGYPTRGNNILGLVRSNDERGDPAHEFEKDALGLPYTTLGYANGPGYTGASASQPEGPKRHLHTVRQQNGIKQGRPDLSDINTADPNFLQEAGVPLAYETHGGEDVAIYADGPGAYLFHGVHEQNFIFHVMHEALGFARRNRTGLKMRRG
jgi:alkaline phosphatase